MKDLKTIGHPHYTMSSFVHHFKAIGEFKLELQSGNAQFGSKVVIFCPPWSQNLTNDLEKQQGTSSQLLKALCFISKPSIYSKWSYSPETPNLGQNRRFFLSRVTLKFDEWSWKTTGHLFYAPSSSVYHFIAFCGIKMKLQPGNTHLGQNRRFLSRVALKFDRWPWKTIGHLFYATSSLVHHFTAIYEFIMELQSGNAQFGSKLAIFLSHVTLKFDEWP